MIFSQHSDERLVMIHVAQFAHSITLLYEICKWYLLLSPFCTHILFSKAHRHRVH